MRNHMVDLRPVIVGLTLLVLVPVLPGAKANSPPELEAYTWDIEVREGEEVWVTFRATDPDGDPITMSAISATFDWGAEWYDLGTGVARYHYIPDHSHDGRWYLCIFAEDSFGARDRMDVWVVVEDVNLPPIWNPIPDVTVLAGTTLDLDVSFTDENPAGPDTMHLEGFPPAGAVLIDHGDMTGTFHWEVPIDATGAYSGTVFVAVDEGGLTDTESPVIHVQPNYCQFTLEWGVPFPLMASPDWTQAYPVRIRHQGNIPITVALTATVAEATWSVALSTSLVSLAPGETQTVTLFVTTPPWAELALVTVSAQTTDGACSASLRECLRVLPIVQIRPDQPAWLPVELVSGVLEARWLNGLPVSGLQARATQTLDNGPELPIARTQTVVGTTDALGVWTFEFPFEKPIAGSASGLGLNAPGNHRLTGLVTYLGHPYASPANEYTVLPWV